MVEASDWEMIEMAETLNLTIGGMSCDHCVASIDRALTALNGVLSCDVHVGSARVAIDEKQITRGELLTAVREAGAYEVTGFASADD
jgi:copper chaperone CopZ